MHYARVHQKCSRGNGPLHRSWRREAMHYGRVHQRCSRDNGPLQCGWQRQPKPAAEPALHMRGQGIAFPNTPPPPLIYSVCKSPAERQGPESDCPLVKCIAREVITHTSQTRHMYATRATYYRRAASDVQLRCAHLEVGSALTQLVLWQVVALGATNKQSASCEHHVEWLAIQLSQPGSKRRAKRANEYAGGKETLMRDREGREGRRSSPAAGVGTR
jgi:hypothetical protein